MTTPIPSPVALPTGLTYGTVRWTVVGIAEDTFDAGDLPDAEQINGTATFVPSWNSLQSAQGRPVTVLPRPEVYLIKNGQLIDKEGRTDVRLVANDGAGTSPQGWTYFVTWELDGGYAFGSFSFKLTGNEVVDLTMAMPIGQDPGVIITRGPKGDPGPGYGGGFATPLNTQSSPITLTIVSNWGVKDDGTVYYNAAGAIASEAGLLVPDPQTGGFTVWRPGSPMANTFEPKMLTAVNNTAGALRQRLDVLYGGAQAPVAAATDAATASTLMKRDANGRAKVADGATAADIATKGQMDAAISTAIATRVPNSALGANSGVATLDSTGKVLASQIPPIAINDTFVVASQTAMLALVAQRGDMARRTDTTPAKLFVLAADDATVLANWVEITAVGAVTSVDGMAGTVVLGDTAASASSLARRSASGTLVVATATAAGEAVRFDQISTFGRDRGTGAALPTTDLRRGDQFFHTGWMSLAVYNGTSWRQEHTASLTAVQRAALPTTGTEQIHAGFSVYESDTGRLYHYRGTKWDLNGGKTPHCMVTRTAALTGITPVAWTGLPFQQTTAESTETSMWAAGNPSRLVAPVSGLYIASMNVGYGIIASGTASRYLGLRKNGQDGSIRRMNGQTDTNPLIHEYGGSAPFSLVAGDYIETVYYTTASGDQINYFSSEVSPRFELTFVGNS